MKKFYSTPIILTMFAFGFLLCHSAAATDDQYTEDSHVDFYQSGPYAVAVSAVSRTLVPAPLTIYSPDVAGAFPVVLFLHGFTGSAGDYEIILTHLASHGFVVVAPQMYREDCYFCAPPPILEAFKGLRLLTWIERTLDCFVPEDSGKPNIGIAGHSRGGQIACRIALAAGDRVQACAAVDPVDGLEMFRQSRITDNPLALTMPAYILGTGLGPVVPENASVSFPCAPSDIGHTVFYTMITGRAWHAVASDNGHADMVDEENFFEGVCPGGPDRDGMRAFTAGTLAAFFSGTLKENPSALSLLSDPEGAPVPSTMESKQLGTPLRRHGSQCFIVDDQSHPMHQLSYLTALS